MTYNGWRNRETWLIEVWFGDSFTDVDLVKEILHADVENIPTKYLQDFMDLDCIDWDELRENWGDNND